MITIESLISIEKDDLQETAKRLDKCDIPQLVDWLAEKDDKIRYQAFLLLQYRAQFFDDVYQFWDKFRSKLKSDNSYQRSIGLMLIAENAKWDAEHKLDHSIDEYLALLRDEKPITVRQCIQSLSKIIPYKQNLNGRIADSLLSLDLFSVKETMRKSILLDILNALAVIRNHYNTEEMDRYILNALSGEILDKKAKKQMESILL